MSHVIKTQVWETKIAKHDRERIKIKLQTTYDNEYQKYRGERIQQTAGIHRVTVVAKNPEFQSPEEQALPKLTEVIANQSRRKIYNALNNHELIARNITVEEKKVLTNLKQVLTIHITKANKGNVTVNLNRLDYESTVVQH